MAMGEVTAWHGIPMKYISLVLLTFQNSALILILHYSCIMPGYEDKRYITSTAVLLNELIKLSVCSAVAYNQFRKNAGADARKNAFLREIFSNDSWKLAIPAFLYTLQNNLQYVAAGNLPAATFQVTYQLKILTTALFSVLLLGRRLSLMKWCSLVVLTAGIAVVQLQNLQGGSSSEENSELNAKTGFVAVIVACLISGLAGVYFEKVLKGTKSSLWIRNIQLSFFSLVPCVFTIFWKNAADIVTHGFFFGYNYVVWTAIFFQAFGGIVVALCVAFADNIMKNFATSISILISFVASVYFFDFAISASFLVGSGMVILATFLYTRPEKKSISKESYIPLTVTPNTHENNNAATKA